MAGSVRKVVVVCRWQVACGGDCLVTEDSCWLSCRRQAGCLWWVWKIVYVSGCVLLRGGVRVLVQGGGLWMFG